MDYQTYVTRNKKLAEINRLYSELSSYLGKDTARLTINNSKDIFNLMSPALSFLDHEELWIIGLDVRNNVRSMVKLYQGNVSSAIIRTCEIFRDAVVSNYPTIVVVHNHPAGEPRPSAEDISTTREILRAGKLLDIQVLDHIIISNTRYTSIKDQDCINPWFPSSW
jgi:DNA repair protein RadC